MINVHIESSTTLVKESMSLLIDALPLPQGLRPAPRGSGARQFSAHSTGFSVLPMLKVRSVVGIVEGGSSHALDVWFDER